MSREANSQLSQPISNRQDLLSYFENGGRPLTRFALGLESEMVGVDARTGEAVPFEGEFGIEAILKKHSLSYGFKEIYDREHLIALDREGSAITLEPGGQLELSTRPHSRLSELTEELDAHVKRLCAISSPLNVRWLNLGLQPVTPLERMPWVPKSRYRIMRPYYEKQKGLALQMMARTASIQANLDYLNEADARRKIRLGSVLGPVVGAMFANSAVEEGKFNGLCAQRLIIWLEMDSARCGVPAFFVDGTFTFERYVDYALDVPMYFIVRNGEYIDYTGKTFRQFWESEKGLNGPLMSDWELHLTTIFTDVRLKNHLEFRTADSVEPELAISLMAFWMGLMHDPNALEEALQRVEAFTLSDIYTAMKDVAHKGLRARMGNEPIVNVARDVVSISSMGLSRLDRDSGLNERRFLDPLIQLAERGTSPAEEIRCNWNGDISTLISECCL